MLSPTSCERSDAIPVLLFMVDVWLSPRGL
jgi:hypothetical protein